MVSVGRVLTTLAVENYRSLRDLVLPLSRLTVVTGANGSGKSSLYRALRLLADAARNGAVAALAREGGLPSTLWAGPESVGRAVREGRAPVQGTRRTKPVGLRLGFAGDEFGYALDLGMPIPSETAFNRDPEFKRECVWTGPVLRPAALLADRAGPVVRARDQSGAWGREPHRIGLIAIAGAIVVSAAVFMRWDWLPNYAGLALQGLWRTIWLLAVTTVLGIALAIPLGFVQVTGPKILSVPGLSPNPGAIPT